MAATYLDSSAVIKLVVGETDSDALRRQLGRRPALVSSALARTEVWRAFLPAGEAVLARGRAVLATLDLVRINDRILNAAGVLLPLGLRSLDAIHLATAAQLGEDLGRVVTYDQRMADAAEGLGMRVSTPR